MVSVLYPHNESKQMHKRQHVVVLRIFDVVFIPLGKIALSLARQMYRMLLSIRNVNSVNLLHWNGFFLLLKTTFVFIHFD